MIITPGMKKIADTNPDPNKNTPKVTPVDLTTIALTNNASPSGSQHYWTEQWAARDPYNTAAKKGTLAMLGATLLEPWRGAIAMAKDSLGIAPPTEKQLSLDSEASNLEDFNYDSILGEFSSGSSSGGGPGMIDISNILKAYEQGAASQREIAKQTYENKRTDLLDSLKRYQEQNKRDVLNQQRSYLSNQAALESAIAQADRQNRISAAARGLGGSGLQQLAQLQNLLSQGQGISDLATANQRTMDDLRTALINQEADTDKGVSRALDTYNNTLNTIASTLASNKANIEYQARENAANRQATANNYANATAAANQEKATTVSQLLTVNQNKAERAIRAINEASSSKIKNVVNPYTGEKLGTNNKTEALQKIYDAASDNARTLLAEYGIGTNTNTSATAINNLAALVRGYY